MWTWAFFPLYDERIKVALLKHFFLKLVWEKNVLTLMLKKKKLYKFLSSTIFLSFFSSSVKGGNIFFCKCV